MVENPKPKVNFNSLESVRLWRMGERGSIQWCAAALEEFLGFIGYLEEGEQIDWQCVDLSQFERKHYNKGIIRESCFGKVYPLDDGRYSIILDENIPYPSLVCPEDIDAVKAIINSQLPYITWEQYAETSSTH